MSAEWQWGLAISRGLRAVGAIALVMSLLPAPAKAADLASQPGYVSGEFIFTSAPFPSCHASTIVETKHGLVAAWFGGTHERHPDVGIWVARQERGGWSAPMEVADGIQTNGVRYPCWNPVLFQPKSGPLLLFYKVGPTPKTWWGMLRESNDAGKTWSQSTRLPEGILGPIKNKPVQLANGDILCPSSSEDHGNRVFFNRVDPALQHWRNIGPVNDGIEIGAIQPSILFNSDGRLEAVGRTEQGRVFQIWSGDDGETWGKMTFLTLPNPDSGIDAVTLADGRHLLVYNHTAHGRSPLNVALSRDGLEWQAALVLENEPGEFSYPAVIQSRDHLVHITYTWQRKRIKHVVIDPARLELRAMENGGWPK